MSTPIIGRARTYFLPHKKISKVMIGWLLHNFENSDISKPTQCFQLFSYVTSFTHSKIAGQCVKCCRAV